MLTRPQVQRYAAESGLRDIMIAEKEVVLTYMLQLLSTHGLLNQLAFKGGTCLRKMFVGSQGRFSTDLDFTSLQEHDHEDIILAMMEAFDHVMGRQFTFEEDDAALNEADTDLWNESWELARKLYLGSQ
jgi:predicted nucleotidyltransferase component of viral defense system